MTQVTSPTTEPEEKGPDKEGTVTPSETVSPPTTDGKEEGKEPGKGETDGTVEPGKGEGGGVAPTEPPTQPETGGGTDKGDGSETTTPVPPPPPSPPTGGTDPEPDKGEGGGTVTPSPDGGGTGPTVPEPPSPPGGGGDGTTGPVTPPEPPTGPDGSGPTEPVDPPTEPEGGGGDGHGSGGGGGETPEPPPVTPGPDGGSGTDPVPPKPPKPSKPSRPKGSSTELQIATDPFFGEVVNKDEDTEYRTSHTFNKDEIPSGVQLYVRVRYDSNIGKSGWSPYVRFSVEVPANIIGVAVDHTTNTVNYIDVNGNKTTTVNPDNHPVFLNSSMVTLDSARVPFTATKIPRFYIKTATSGPVGSFAEGKTCFFLSDAPHPGFRPHPAFKRSMRRDSFGKYELADYIYIGTYLGHAEQASERDTLGSAKGKTVLTGKTRDDFLALVSARNDVGMGELGYHITDIYEVSAMRWLGLIKSGRFDFQSAFGSNKTARPITGSTNSKLILRGSKGNPQVFIDDAWNCYWQFVDLINLNEGIVNLRSPMDRATALSLSGTPSKYRVSRQNGWVKSFLSTSYILGDDAHDILELFLPDTVDAAPTGTAVPDFHEYGTETTEVKIGGDWDSGEQGGMFADTTRPEHTKETIHHEGTPDETQMIGYCGNVTYCNTATRQVKRSSGLGKVVTTTYTGTRPVVCIGSAYGTQGEHQFAPCDDTDSWDVWFPCPKGWGNKSDKDGCLNGTRYQTIPGKPPYDEVVDKYADNMAMRVSKS